MYVLVIYQLLLGMPIIMINGNKIEIIIDYNNLNIYNPFIQIKYNCIKILTISNSVYQYYNTA